MDDVLWVLTDSQVFAAMTFVDDLRNIIVNNQVCCYGNIVKLPLIMKTTSNLNLSALFLY